ncbi:MAG TPA: HlyD family secretion protein, partial [Rhodocyclaceae bacterium]|nr:HlyD family secretion protein [Rhodocyclaceae bacterium]
YRQAAQLAVADDEKGRLEMSQRKGRMEEKAAELAYSEQLLDRVQVKSPREGVAVFADASDWIGKAVTIGERVMQIADPTKVELTIRLPVADAIDLEPDASTTLYLTTAPQLSYDAKLTYLAYKSEATHEGVVAYKLKADFVAEETLPRLGLTGTAKIYGEWAPFAYYLLRRPLAAARQWLGW